MFQNPIKNKAECCLKQSTGLFRHLCALDNTPMTLNWTHLAVNMILHLTAFSGKIPDRPCWGEKKQYGRSKIHQKRSHKGANKGKKYPTKPQHFSVVTVITQHRHAWYQKQPAQFKQRRAGAGVYVVPLFIKNGWEHLTEKSNFWSWLINLCCICQICVSRVSTRL